MLANSVGSRRRTALRATLALGLAAMLGSWAYEAAESPASQLFGKTVVSGPANERVVALTYDDGPNPPYTDKILDVLEREHVHATFFLVGRAVMVYPATVRRELRDGDAIGNHTWSHDHMIVLDRTHLLETLRKTDAAIYHATGTHTTIMRPPYGGRDWLVLSEVRRAGYTPIMWSVPLAKDWEYPPARVIAARVLPYVHDGSIIVLHDGNRGITCARDRIAQHVCDRHNDIEATRMIVDSLKRQGYRFVTIPELISLGRPIRTPVRVGE